MLTDVTDNAADFRVEIPGRVVQDSSATVLLVRNRDSHVVEEGSIERVPVPTGTVREHRAGNPELRVVEL